jgi:hypothetical protein
MVTTPPRENPPPTRFSSPARATQADGGQLGKRSAPACLYGVCFRKEIDVSGASFIIRVTTRDMNISGPRSSQVALRSALSSSGLPSQVSGEAHL